MAECEAPDEDIDIAGINGLTARGMWSHVLHFSNLHFIVPDVKDERPWWQIL